MKKLNNCFKTKKMTTINISELEIIKSSRANKQLSEAQIKEISEIVNTMQVIKASDITVHKNQRHTIYELNKKDGLLSRANLTNLRALQAGFKDNALYLKFVTRA